VFEVLYEPSLPRRSRGKNRPGSGSGSRSPPTRALDLLAIYKYLSRGSRKCLELARMCRGSTFPAQ
jgi:hypothetical protein